jgi:transposase InsO family protein
VIHETIKRCSTTQPIQRLCRLGTVPRCAYYRALSQTASHADSFQGEIQSRIQSICVEHAGYGYRMVTKQLQAEGYRVNHKRILRLMRRDNLLCLRKRRWVHTTQSNHGYRVYPNLARDIALEKPDQLWVADITYIRLPRECVYLAVLLDAYSRRAIGWAVERSLRTSLTITALQMAFQTRCVGPGLVHHSDRGMQYASDEYTALLQMHGILISMSRSGNPYDNATVESFIKTLKQNEVYLADYHSLEEARENIEYFLATVYNQRRLHSSLGYLTPSQYEDRFHQQHLGVPSPFA